MPNSHSDDQDFEPGSILKRDLDGVPGTALSHVGVYCGQGKVVHFDGEWGSGAEAAITESTVAEFAKGRHVRVHCQPHSEAHGAAVLAEARKILDRPGEWNGKYGLLLKNCEDFARHCFKAKYHGHDDQKKLTGKPPLSQKIKAVATACFVVIGTAASVYAQSQGKRGGPRSS